MLAALVVYSAVVAGLAQVVGTDYVPPGALLTFAVLVGGLLLSPHRLRLLFIAVAAALVYDLAILGSDDVRVGGIVAIAASALISYQLARSRERLGGMSSIQGEAMLLELSEQLRSHGTVPTLPDGWSVEASQRSAGGASFGGDFLVSSVRNGGEVCEIALVDVSGKGLDAGTRALLLAGAFGGLLGAVEATEFLAAANSYVLRQRWAEGFATAVHVSLELTTGAYRLASAGHPPAAHYARGSGRWRLSMAGGPALGLVDEPEYAVETGVLQSGDALLLYTDGLVEIPGRDLVVGIDRLLGQAERLVSSGFEGGAEWLVNAVARTSPDDRALVLLWRG